MQLAQAIESWLRTHGSTLSAATRRDIREIAVSAKECGLAKLECSGLSVSDRALLATEGRRTFFTQRGRYR